MEYAHGPIISQIDKAKPGKTIVLAYDCCASVQTKQTTNTSISVALKKKKQKNSKHETISS